MMQMPIAVLMCFVQTFCLYSRKWKPCLMPQSRASLDVDKNRLGCRGFITTRSCWRSKSLDARKPSDTANPEIWPNSISVWRFPEQIMNMKDWYVISANNLKTHPCYLGLHWVNAIVQLWDNINKDIFFQFSACMVAVTTGILR